MTLSASEAAFYREQARLFAGASEMDSWDASSVPPERGPVPEDGSFTARILGIDLVARTVTVDRIQLFQADAGEKALEDGELEPPSGQYVRNRVVEELELPLADIAVFVVNRINTDWQEGNLSVETSVGPPVIAMPASEFATLLKDDATARETLRFVGAVVTLAGGDVVLVKGNYTP